MVAIGEAVTLEGDIILEAVIPAEGTADASPFRDPRVERSPSTVLYA